MENGHIFDREKCISCGKCEDVCLGAAIKFYGRVVSVDEVMPHLLADKDFFENSGGGVTLSGGECLAQSAFATALAKSPWEKGISVDIDTCGYVRQEGFEGIIPYTDTFLYDLKAIDPQVHKRCTGRENQLILENLRYLCHHGCRVEIRYPYVPGYNDTECEKIGAFLKELPNITKVKVLGYHSYADGKYAALSMENTLPDVVVTPEDVQKAVDCLKQFGLNAINGMQED
jgi:pyruvate formate lyase activating enzyme